ncbi:hypothetical protein D8674_009665 [Pyrus ussuriensis x Pyrus communis]|uniref:RING-type domain-containing protein n=1 Tax=Pyrus ussuriensis x Pyrus communis TaxID=2448454 RepID=A0A5N5FM88_9ROSA|nr:hypothetical protein D8674_009665 [Pyrus ussuriensis x Pyrus communis]
MDSPSSVLSSDDATTVKCSICIEGVFDNYGRTIVKLQCSHLFHLDCIGSAFNVKGVMECPNCREIENGEWRYYVSRSPDRELELSEDEMDYEDSPIEFLDMGQQGTMLRHFHHGEWETGWLSPTCHGSEPHFEADLLDHYSVLSGNPYTYNQWTGLPVPSEVFPSNPSRIDWRPEPLICDSCTNLFSPGGANWSSYPSATLSSGIDYIGMPNAPFVPRVVEGGYESLFGFAYQGSNDPLHPNFPTMQQLPTNFPSQAAHASMGRSNDLMHWHRAGQTTTSLGQTADSIPFSVNMNSSLSSATNGHHLVQEGNRVQPQRLFPEDARSLTSFFPDVNQ